MTDNMDTGTSGGNGFCIDDAKKYWKYVPTGLGYKVSSSELLALDDSEFVNATSTHLSCTNLHYFEDVHFIKYFCEEFKGKSVLSVGSGVGNNELQFMNAGANVTCADIVIENLQVVQRIADLSGLGGIKTILLNGECTDDLKGGYDYIYCRGSLHHMPFPLQKKMFQNFVRSLKEGGSIILMLYTKQFEDDFSRGQDEKAFGVATDPDCNGVSNPWSEWYDDAKLMELSEGEFAIVRKQLWNEGWYQWVELKRETSPRQTPFIDLNEVERHEDGLVEDVRVAGATARRNARLSVVGNSILLDVPAGSTVDFPWHRRILPRFLRGKAAARVNKITFTADVEYGHASLSIYDLSKRKYLYNKSIASKGEQVRAVYFTEDVDIRDLKVHVAAYADARLVLSRLSYGYVDNEKSVPYGLNLL